MHPRPVFDDRYETNVPGIYLAGSIIDAAGIMKSANQGHRIAMDVASRVKGQGPDATDIHDLVIVGAGPAGLSAAMTAQGLGLDAVVFDKYFMGATLLAMPEGKVFDVNYKDNQDKPEGRLWYETSPAPLLHSRWRNQVLEAGLDLHENEAVQNIVRELDTGHFKVVTEKGRHRARYVLVAMGKSGHPRHLNVMGELVLKNKGRLFYKYRGQTTIQGQNILVIGGGNTAAEAVMGLAEMNHVTMSYRKSGFQRLTDKNQAMLESLCADGAIQVLFDSNVLRFEDDSVVLLIEGRTRKMRFDRYYILIGFDLPYDFLSTIGVKIRQ